MRKMGKRVPGAGKGGEHVNTVSSYYCPECELDRSVPVYLICSSASAGSPPQTHAKAATSIKHFPLQNMAWFPSALFPRKPHTHPLPSSPLENAL